LFFYESESLISQQTQVECAETERIVNRRTGISSLVLDNLATSI